MNKFNSIFEALNEIEDNIVSETIKAKKHPLRKKVLLIAAAAAVFSLMAGFAYFHFEFTLELAPQYGMLLPNYEEMTKWGATELGDYSQGVSGMPVVGYHYHFKKTTLPSDLFQKFNIHPLINDNFAEEPTEVFANAVLCDTAENLYANSIHFTYNLTDKETGVPVEFDIECAYERRSGQDCGYEVYDGQKTTVSFQDAKETFTLNNGSRAFISDCEWGGGIRSEVWFCYDGIFYTVYADIDSEAMKGVLERLGVL